MGGGLIAASFLVAVLLNRSASEETAPVERASRPLTFAKIRLGRRPLGPGRVPDTAVEECKRATESLQR